MRAVLFDLDGTLLDVDTGAFMRRYFEALRSFPVTGWDGDLLEAITTATESMMGQHPGVTNADVFWADFSQITGHGREEWEPVFDVFYRDWFPGLRESAGPAPGALRAMATVRSRGLKVAVATNPMFPRGAIDQRLSWAGFGDLDDSVLVTSYETSTACKPWPEYFAEVARRLEIAPSDCLMVGDDPAMDLGCRDIGMKSWLLEEPPAGWSTDYAGTLDQLADLIDRL